LDNLLRLVIHVVRKGSLFRVEHCLLLLGNYSRLRDLLEERVFFAHHRLPHRLLMEKKKRRRKMRRRKRRKEREREIWGEMLKEKE
jgi:CRISPR/Cas system-associated protein Csx1